MCVTDKAIRKTNIDSSESLQMDPVSTYHNGEIKEIISKSEGARAIWTGKNEIDRQAWHYSHSLFFSLYLPCWAIYYSLFTTSLHLIVSVPGIYLMLFWINESFQHKSRSQTFSLWDGEVFSYLILSNHVKCILPWPRFVSPLRTSMLVSLNIDSRQKSFLLIIRNQMSQTKALYHCKKNHQFASIINVVVECVQVYVWHLCSHNCLSLQPRVCNKTRVDVLHSVQWWILDLRCRTAV